MPAENLPADFQKNLDALVSDGFLLLRGALDPAAIQAWRDALQRQYDAKAWDIRNNVGNVAFDRLLEREPALARPLVGHASVAPYLKALLGRQCQLRSLRAHVNPAAYTQEWHMDFYSYWNQENEGKFAVRGLCVNTTFYLTDNTPETGRLTFLKEYRNRPVPAEFKDNQYYTEDRNNPFQKWCDAQPQTHLHPLAGDVVVFLSHVPHQGAKLRDDAPGTMRSNVVLHYQTNPMYPGAAFVSSPHAAVAALGFEGTFPFAGR
ncbi:MAG: phytanoyl-CoA dioxygenase family protein [Planctomycetota bacterium]|nr:phytanoyl-CoA dioxygenase family protein [Planctomycetota bacterium]